RARLVPAPRPRWPAMSSSFLRFGLKGALSRLDLFPRRRRATPSLDLGIVTVEHLVGVEERRNLELPVLGEVAEAPHPVETRVTSRDQQHVAVRPLMVLQVEARVGG